MPDVALDLRYLKCAICAAEHRSFRRAAEALGLSQPTLTRRIQMLEDRLGFPLFARSRSGIELTSGGRSFLRSAAIGADHLKLAIRVANAVHRSDTAPFNVGIIPSFTSCMLRRLLGEFRQQHADTQLILHEGASQELLIGVTGGELDVAFMPFEPRAPGYSSKAFWSESLCVALQSAHPLAQLESISWAQLRSETFLVTQDGPGAEVRDFINLKLALPGFHPCIEVHNVSGAGLLDLVAMGFGVTLISAVAAQGDTEWVALRRISGEIDILSSYAVWSPDRVGSPLRRLLRLADAIASGAVLPSS